MVDIAEMLTPAIADLLKKFSEQGLNSREANKELDTLREVMRERLRRDMRYNAELMSDARLDPAIKILNLEIDSLEFVCGQGIPLALLFNRSLNAEQRLSFSGSNKSHSQRFQDLDTEAKLIERTLHRAKLSCHIPEGDMAVS